MPRLHALDAMRGVFCIVVIFGHFFLTLPVELKPSYRWFMFLTPMRFGFSFIIVFFMLSGFVLALPYGLPSPPDYRTFIVKRLARLYLPYLAITLMTFLLYFLSGTSPSLVSDMSFHIENIAHVDVFSLDMLGRTLLMTGIQKDLLLNPATWTLVQEVRIALIFPFLIFLCRHSWVGFSFMIFCYVVVYLAQNSIGHFIVFSGLTDDYPTTWITTLYVIPCFMCGIFLAKYRSHILAFINQLPVAWHVTLWIMIAVNFSFIPDYQVRQPFTEFAAAPLIMLVLSSKNISKIVDTPVLKWLGRHSYSIYLVHLPILFALEGCLYGRLGLGWIMALCFIITFPVSAFTYHFIEEPTRRLAKKLLPFTP